MKIALVGNQNSGKTTLFNFLTGSNQKIGNWPGVTIEKKEGIIKNSNHLLVDLPGIYSLSPYSIEEEISSNYILNNKFDLIINVIDANCLERSLYLTTQLLELDCKLIIIVNMIDILNKDGINIDINTLEKMLKVPIISSLDLKKEGTCKLIGIINNLKINNQKNNKIFSNEIEEIIEKLSNKFKFNNRFLSIKALEENDIVPIKINVDIFKNTLENKYKYDTEEIIATQRYNYIDKIVKLVISGSKKKSDYLDKILLNRFLSIPIILIIMSLIYYFSIGVVGNFSNAIVSDFVILTNNKIYSILSYLNVSEWLISLICDGIINGVGSIFTFLPQLAVLFFLIEFLEETGYMARISFVLDNFFSRIGLSGKSLIPFIVGTGCSVPGVMSTRIIEDNIKREKSIMLVPFIPCSAKLPIIIMISNSFFSNNKYFPVLVYLIVILTVIASSIVLSKIYIKNQYNSYIMELPRYKMPNLSHISKEVKEKILSFIKRVGSVILVCSIFVWILLSFSPNFKYNVPIEESILSYIGQKISWIFYPFIGTNNWAVSVSIIQGLIAKEQVISSMAIISKMNSNLFQSDIFSFFTPVSALSFLTFNLFSIPCLSTISAMKKELGSLRKLILCLFFQLIIAFIISTLIYQIGILLW